MVLDWCVQSYRQGKRHGTPRKFATAQYAIAAGSGFLHVQGAVMERVVVYHRLYEATARVELTKTTVDMSQQAARLDQLAHRAELAAKS